MALLKEDKLSQTSIFFEKGKQTNKPFCKVYNIIEKLIIILLSSPGEGHLYVKMNIILKTKTKTNKQNKSKKQKQNKKPNKG